MWRLRTSHVFLLLLELWMFSVHVERILNSINALTMAIVQIDNVKFGDF